MTSHEVHRTRRRILGAAVLVVTLASIALLRGVLESPAGDGGTSGAASTQGIVVGHAHDAGYQPYPSERGPTFLLVLGSDARPGETVDEARSDAIHVVGINFGLHRASVIDIPRDSWVPIPGHRFDKINAAMSLGGVPLTIRTVEELTGIRFDYYAITSFPGLEAMIDGIGGLRIRVPYDIHDPTDGGPPIAGGMRTLDGRSALAFSRARHFVPGGDFGRTENQGAMLIAALRQYQRQVAGDPATMLTWLGTFMRNVESDLSLDELTTLAYAAAQIPSTNVNNVALQGTTGYEGSQSVVHLSARSRAVFADIRNDGVVGHRRRDP
jgi:LCP family protein required for cell wall assembly